MINIKLFGYVALSKRARTEKQLDVKVTGHRNLLESRSCTWSNRTPEKHSPKNGLSLSYCHIFCEKLSNISHLRSNVLEILKFKACFSSTETLNFVSISNLIKCC